MHHNITHNINSYHKHNRSIIVHKIMKEFELNLLILLSIYLELHVPKTVMKIISSMLHFMTH